MKNLSQILKNIKINHDLVIKGIKTNSNQIEAGDLFLCIKGVNVDRHDYIEDAASRGAICALVSKDVKASIPCIKVDDVDALVDDIYRNFYDNPQDELFIIGLTGTDGKTSTATIVQNLMGSDICGYIGTNGYGCAKFKRKTANTTPDKDKLYQYFREFVDAGCKYVAMEASSEAFLRGRLSTLQFRAAAISNITSEHLNVHKTLENYISCKAQLFKQTTKDAVSILNHDDKHYEEIKAVAHNVKTYGRGQDNDLWIKDYEIYPNKTKINFVYKDKEYNIESPLLGGFNVENLAEAMLLCLNLGLDMDVLISRIKNLKISGRMEHISLGQDFYCLVDYAHTPNGITRFLEFAKTLDVKRKIVVIGQAGERDAYKRKEVGEICARNADHVIFTYEDPRSEDVNDIIDDMCENIHDLNNYERVIDRGEAIAKAINMAKKDDIVMILGKGAEDYQKLKSAVIHFSDIEEASKAIEKRLKNIK